MLISKTIEFDAGHRVPNHKSKCRSPHGHRYKVEVTISGDPNEEIGTSDEGMVLDYGDLKSVMTEYIHDVFDHSFIVYRYDKTMRAAFEHIGGAEGWKIVIVDTIPTAENLAILIWESLIRLGFKNLDAVEIWETPTSWAYYGGPEYQAVTGRS